MYTALPVNVACNNCWRRSHATLTPRGISDDRLLRETYGQTPSAHLLRGDWRVDVC